MRKILITAVLCGLLLLTSCASSDAARAYKSAEVAMQAGDYSEAASYYDEAV